MHIKEEQELHLNFSKISSMLRFIIFVSSISVLQLIPIYAKVDAQNALRNVLERLQREKPYESILLMETRNVDCLFEGHVHEIADVPIISMDEEGSYYMRAQVNSEILAIVCLQGVQHIGLLRALASALNHMRDNRVMILLSEPDHEGELSTIPETLFKICLDLDLLFVNIFYADFYKSLEYVTYQAYPQFELQTHSLMELQTLLYPTGIRNFGGKTLTVATSLEISRNHLNYYTTHDNVTLATGMLGWFMLSYAAHYNASLSLVPVLSYTPGEYTFGNYTMKIEAKIFNPSTDNLANCVVLYVEWIGIILPVEKPMKKASFLLPVLQQTIKVYGIVSTMLICALIAILERHKLSQIYLVITQMDLFRGLLGYGFSMRRNPGYLLGLVYIIVMVQGFFNNTIYSVNLGTIFTVMPKEKPIRTFEEMLARGYPKVRKGNSTIKSAMAFFNTKFFAIYEIANMSRNDFFMNGLPSPDYAYDLMLSLWPMYDHIQNSYKIKLFRFDSHMIFPMKGPIFFAFIYPSNSHFQRSMQLAYSRADESGLFFNWLLRNRSIHIEPPDLEPQPLTLEDYDKFFLVYLIMLAISFLIFILEIGYAYRSKRQ